MNDFLTSTISRLASRLGIFCLSGIVKGKKECVLLFLVPLLPSREGVVARKYGYGTGGGWRGIFFFFHVFYLAAPFITQSTIRSSHR